MPPPGMGVARASQSFTGSTLEPYCTVPLSLISAFGVMPRIRSLRDRQ